jgi:hypothetical protein
MFDLLIENNRGVSWAERLWLLEASETKLSTARSPSCEPLKASEAFRAILACFEGSETKQNRTQRQQLIDDLHKLSKSRTPGKLATCILRRSSYYFGNHQSSRISTHHSIFKWQPHQRNLSGLLQRHSCPRISRLWSQGPMLRSEVLDDPPFTLEVQLVLKSILSYEDHNFEEDTKSLRLGR